MNNAGNTLDSTMVSAGSKNKMKKLLDGKVNYSNNFRENLSGKKVGGAMFQSIDQQNDRSQSLGYGGGSIRIP